MKLNDCFPTLILPTCAPPAVLAGTSPGPALPWVSTASCVSGVSGCALWRAQVLIAWEAGSSAPVAAFLEETSLFATSMARAAACVGSPASSPRCLPLLTCHFVSVPTSPQLEKETLKGAQVGLIIMPVNNKCVLVKHSTSTYIFNKVKYPGFLCSHLSPPQRTWLTSLWGFPLSVCLCEVYGLGSVCIL